MANLWKAYTHVLEKHPWKTQMLQTGVLMGFGDFLAQTAVEKKKFRDLEPGRMARFALIGTLYVGPVLRGWYGYLDKTFGPTGAKNLVKKVATDQLMFAPFFMGSVLGVIEASRNGQDWEKTKQFVRHVWTDVMITNWMIWPWVQFGNFYAVPLDYRILVTQSFSVVFNTYLAWKTNLKDDVKPKMPSGDKKRLSLDDFERAG